MKISELLLYVDELKPNAFPADTKVAWLNEVEGMVWCDVMLLSPVEFRSYEYNDQSGEGDDELLVIPPHNKIYAIYLCAMIDFYNGEYDRYQNSITLFNAYFGEYMRWYALNYRPADGGFKYMGEYITAYGIAVKHGFEGTEEEWLLSLHGTVDEEMVEEFINNYLDEHPIPSPVQSVNGKTGEVKLSADDVGARPNTWTPSAADVGALPANTKIPSSTSDLNNDSEFITSAVSDLINYYLKSEVYSKDETYSKDEIGYFISQIPKFTISVVTSLPASNISSTTVYLVKSSTTEDRDLYTEYIYVNGKWEILGSQKVDLTGYATETWVSGQLANYIKISEFASLIVSALMENKVLRYSAQTLTDAEKAQARENIGAAAPGEGGGGIDEEQLQGAIEDALAEAKASGMFDGADGIGISTAYLNESGELVIVFEGDNGEVNVGNVIGPTGNGIKSAVLNDDYTLTLRFTNGTNYTTSSIRGAAGKDGADGVSPTVSTSKSGKVTTITITDKNGTKKATINDGADGTSVGISNIQQSELPGDFSTIEFTDGKELNIYNGNDGRNGTSVTVSNVSESTASGGTNTVTFSDGKKVNILNGKDGKDGEDGVGADGQRGTGILKVTTAPESYNTTTAGVTPIKRMAISTIKSEAGVDEVLVGDCIAQSYYLHHIYYLDATYAYTDNYQSIRGATGAAGASSEWYVGTGITGTSTTATIFSGSGVSSATVGDMYLNTSTYNVYRCSTAGAASAAKWVYVCNIKGAKGDKGDAYTLTDTDKNTIANAVKSSLPTLTMVGVDADGVSHTWTIYGS